MGVKRLRPVDLAREHGLSTQAVRNYEEEGILPGAERTPSGYRVYTSTDVRDAHPAHQFRRGGYLLHQIAPLIAQVRHAGGVAPLESTLDEWRTRLSIRGLSMLTAAAELSTYLGDREVPGKLRHNDRDTWADQRWLADRQ